MKKIFLFLLVGMFMISFASAVEFNNVKIYNNETKTVTIKESLLGKQIANVTLLTPEINDVPVGKDIKVMELEIINLNDVDYKDIFQDWTFYNLKDQEKKITKTIDLKMKITYLVDVPIYNYTYEGSYGEENFSINKELVGYEKEIMYGWEKLTPADIKKGQKVTVGLFTDTKNGDLIDGVPKMWGLDLEEFAVWNSSYEVNLTGYWSLNETTGDFIDYTGNQDGVDSTTDTGLAGATNNTNNSIGISGADLVSITNHDGLNMSQNDLTIRAWLYTDNNGTVNQHAVAKPYTSASSPFVEYSMRLTQPSSTSRLTLAAGFGGSYVEVADTGCIFPNQDWTHSVIVYNNSHVAFYLDGSLCSVVPQTGSLGHYNTALAIGELTNFNQHWDGKIDEVLVARREWSAGEVLNDYNGGFGLTPWTLAPASGLTITLVNPQNTTYTTQPISIDWTNSSEYDVAYYNLNGAGNTTLTQNDTVDAVFGYNSLIIYANDSSTGDWASDTEYFNFQPTLLTQQLSPANATNQSSITPTLTWNVTKNGTIAISNVTLRKDNVVVYTNDSGLEGNYSYTDTLTDGDWHYWNITVVGNDTNEYNSTETWQYAYWNNETVVTVTLVSPSDDTLYTVPDNFTSNATSNQYLVNASLYTNSTGSWVINQTKIIDDPNKETLETTFSSTQATTDYRGVLIFVGDQPINLYGFEASGPLGDQTTRAAVAWENGTIIDTVLNTTGTFYTFDNPILLNANTYYRLLTDDQGDSYTANYLGSPSFPYVAGEYNVTAGSYPTTNRSDYWSVGVITSSTFNITSKEVSFEKSFTDTLLWNVEYCTNDNACNFSSSNFTALADLTNPTLNITYPIGLLDYGRAGNSTQLNWSITDDGTLDTCIYDYDGSNASVTCTDNTTNFNLADTTQEIKFYANDSFGNSVFDNQSWNYKVFEVQRYFNATTGQTETNSFTIDLDGNASLTNVTFYYNGTSYNAVQSGTNWTSSLTSPDSGSYDFYWNVTYGSEYIITDTSTQTVTSLSLGFCNSTLLYPFLDLRFADESNVTNNLSSSVSSGNIYFWLSDSTQNITFSFSNVTENSNYTFCATPTDDTISLIYDLTYSSSGYNQRRVRSPITLTTNTTVNDTLYLLSTGDSSQKTLQVVDAVNNLITGALITVERDLSGYKLVASGLTGAAGSLAVYLDGDVEYRFNVSKSGFSSTSSIFAPSEDSYTFTLGVESISQIVDYTDGINISIRPGADTQLLNDTAYNFNLTLTADNDNLDLYGFYLLDEDGNVIDSKFSSDSSGDTINILINTGSYKEVVMKYIWSINNTNQTVYTYWNVFNTQYNSWSISNFFSDLNAYLDSGLFGIDGFGKLIIVYIIVLITLGYMTSKYGFVNEITLSIIVFAVIYFFEIAVGLLPNVLGYSGFFTTLAGVIAVALIINRGLSR